MTDLSFSIPPAMLQWLETRVAEGQYTDPGDYLRDLLRREQDAAEETEWLREQIDIGRASGIIDKDPREVIEEIIAERRARRA